MIKIIVDVSDELHYMIKRIQIDLETQGDKKQLKEVYAELLKIGAIQFKSLSRDHPDENH